MDHDDDVRVLLQRESVGGLLVGAVAAVLQVDFDLRLRQRAGDGHGLVAAVVVHDLYDDEIDLRHDLLMGLFPV